MFDLLNTLLRRSKAEMPTAQQALPGREQALTVTNRHAVLHSPLLPPYPDDCDIIIIGMGCFWGAEKRFWSLPGVYSTAVGYTAGFTPNPHYEEVCSGQTGHNEVVKVIYHRSHISLDELLKQFWESHDPTQGMRQGNDSGTQYRSGIYCNTDQQLQRAEQSKAHFQLQLNAAGKGAITTEIQLATPFYYAEDYHQQYLAKNPGGYCGLGGTGVCY